jgi:hypothetical protein
MQVGSLVRSKWINGQHFGVLIRCTYDIGCRYWRVHWTGSSSPITETLEEEGDLELLCE